MTFVALFEALNGGEFAEIVFCIGRNSWQKSKIFLK
jgi:hypothetical protein